MATSAEYRSKFAGVTITHNGKRNETENEIKGLNKIHEFNNTTAYKENDLKQNKIRF